MKRRKKIRKKRNDYERKEKKGKKERREGEKINFRCNGSLRIGRKKRSYSSKVSQASLEVLFLFYLSQLNMHHPKSSRIHSEFPDVKRAKAYKREKNRGTSLRT